MSEMLLVVALKYIDKVLLLSLKFCLVVSVVAGFRVKGLGFRVKGLGFRV